jgi:antitoxin (DNA-binding transcriptional repressor) of toxin-antitoxin stability system
MKTMTIRDIRQHWPEAERQLAIEKEIIITRDGKPVAKLSSVEEPVEKMQKFDPERQREKREEIFGKGVTVDWVKDFCEVGRAEREF